MNDYICPDCGHLLEVHSETSRHSKSPYRICECDLDPIDILTKIIATKDQALAEAREAIASLNGLARGLEDDDPYFFEQRNGNEIVEHASQWLQKWSEK